jgi:hypothetical protein
MRSLALLALLAGCAPFHLATTGHAPLRAVVDLDILACKDAARTSLDTPRRQVASFLAGATLIAIPADYASRKQAYREAFAACLTARGWTGITLATD